ncbi:glycosyltransferase family 4 protein [Brevundimonas sp. SL130]|uniref:glycosyltransferase family 4 protein n=1 Tax=Brevundimonas sp. SL130 TaxID=2995143 RepID=UPI00226CF0C6|nr:glycosyltransferase family 1 protein [Brevundimonas sp. SL130]WAC59095.1 glycosyltransferase family 1 protein [Brevundimonas sp. SL130]
MAESHAAELTVFINGRFLTQPLSGVQRYAREMIRALDRRPGAGTRYVLLTPPGADPSSLDLRSIPVRTVTGGRGHLWEQIALAWAARRGRLLSLGGSSPILHPRQRVVIHDAAVFRHPEHFRRGYAVFHRVLGRLLSRIAVLATVSQFSRGELAAVLGLPESHIAVVPNGADHLMRATPLQGPLADLDLTGRPYFVALGNLAPNKNLAVMIRALGRLPDPDLRLVLIGAAAPAIFDRAAPAADPRVLFAGRRTDAEVAPLLRGARALIFASLYEGFGIPPLEAFAQDRPVIASDIPAVREVCGDAPDYFAPWDDAALADHMAALLRAGPAPHRFAQGRARLAFYTWDGSARRLETWLAEDRPASTSR